VELPPVVVRDARALRARADREGASLLDAVGVERLRQLLDHAVYRVAVEVQQVVLVRDRVHALVNGVAAEPPTAAAVLVPQLPQRVLLRARLALDGRAALAIGRDDGCRGGHERVLKERQSARRLQHLVHRLDGLDAGELEQLGHLR
jgi:hypothetical protein